MGAADSHRVFTGGGADARARVRDRDDARAELALPSKRGGRLTNDEG